MAAFYRQFGWSEAPTSVPEHVLFQCTNGVVLSLFGAGRYDEQFGEAANGFRGFTLTVHCADSDAVVRAHDVVREFDDVHELDEEPARSGWGCGFSFRDPEGNVWDVAWKAGSELDERDGFRYP